MKTLPRTPRYERCARIAHSILVKYSTPILPIDIMEIINNTKKTRAVAYSAVAKRCQMDIKDVCRTLGSKDGSVQKVASSKPYVIHYNDSIETPGRIRWSIAHEFGHIALGHLDDFPQLDFHRHGISEAEYNVLEKEADAFAGTLLAPLCLLYEINLFDRFELSALTGLSEKATDIKMQHLKKYKKSGPFKAHEITLLNFFKSYLSTKEYLKTTRTSACLKCGAHLPPKTGRQFCQICGESTKMYAFKFKALPYTGIDVDSSGHPATCPKCNTKNTLKSDYCPNCGSQVRNKCTSENCGIDLDGHSRFCHKCGSESIYVKSQLLRDWSFTKQNDYITKGITPMFVKLKPEVVNRLQQLTAKCLNPEIIQLVTEEFPNISFHEIRGSRIYFKDQDNFYRSSFRSDGIHLIRAKRAKF